MRVRAGSTNSHSSGGSDIRYPPGGGGQDGTTLGGVPSSYQQASFQVRENEAR